MHRQLPPTAEHRSSVHPAFPLGLPPWVTALPQAQLLPVSQTWENPTKGSAQPFPAAGLHIPAETATLMAWDVSWSPHHLRLCKGRLGREFPQHPVCAPLGDCRSRKSTLWAPGEAKHLLHCHFPVHQHSPAQSAEEGIRFFQSSGNESAQFRTPKYDPVSYCLGTGSSNQLFIQEL